jgi:hypothetical protein
VESANPLSVEIAEEPQPVMVREAVQFTQVANVIIRQPTAAEVSGLSFGPSSATDDQELSNEFARLLNRGSSLE